MVAFLVIYSFSNYAILIIKITANVIVISLFRTVRLSSGAIFNEK